MADIPSEICREIFFRLPAISLIRLRSVCKSWRHVIDDPIFVKAHTNKQLSSNTILIRNSTGPPFYPHYSVDIETLHFADGIQTITATPLNFSPGGLSRLSSSPPGRALHVPAACNGLMLFSPRKGDNKNWEIWNLLTHERLELPERNFSSKIAASGLGYVDATDDYKVVVIDCLSRPRLVGKHFYETHIYSLKLDLWRKIKNRPFADWNLSISDTCVYLNGALHWISWGVNMNMIIAFDLGTESYRQIKLPPFQEMKNEKMVGKYDFDVLGGYLTVSDYAKDDYDYKHFDVWVMKDYGAQDSWIKCQKVKNVKSRFVTFVGVGLLDSLMGSLAFNHWR